jgi:hypothetical protein
LYLHLADESQTETPQKPDSSSEEDSRFITCSPLKNAVQPEFSNETPWQ